MKRVIGVPGDKVLYRGKSLFVNGVMVETSASGIFEGIGSSVSMSGAQMFEERLDGRSYRILINPNFGSPNGTAVVPADQYFVLGDNRDNSRDSRYWGFVPADHLIGRVEIVWLNWD